MVQLGTIATCVMYNAVNFIVVVRNYWLCIRVERDDIQMYDTAFSLACRSPL